MIDLKKLAETDPVKRNVEKGLEQVEHTPMDPPDAYAESTAGKVKFEEMEQALQIFVNEHKVAVQKIDAFENALKQFKESGYKFDNNVSQVFSEFFHFFDNNIMLHNHKEEKTLFPLLNKKLIDAGEHSVGEHTMTAIDVMEDDHVKFIQLGALTFNLIGLATRLADERSRFFVLDTAVQNGRELIELLRLHIFREDYTLFPLAQKLISKEEFTDIEKAMNKFA